MNDLKNEFKKEGIKKAIKKNKKNPYINLVKMCSDI